MLMLFHITITKLPARSNAPKYFFLSDQVTKQESPTDNSSTLSIRFTGTMEDLSSSWKCTNACVPTKPQRALHIYCSYSIKLW